VKREDSKKEIDVKKSI